MVPKVEGLVVQWVDICSLYREWRERRPGIGLSWEASDYLEPQSKDPA